MVRSARALLIVLILWASFPAPQIRSSYHEHYSSSLTLCSLVRVAEAQVTLPNVSRWTAHAVWSTEETSGGLRLKALQGEIENLSAQIENETAEFEQKIADMRAAFEEEQSVLKSNLTQMEEQAAALEIQVQTNAPVVHTMEVEVDLATGEFCYYDFRRVAPNLWDNRMVGQYDPKNRSFYLRNTTLKGRIIDCKEYYPDVSPADLFFPSGALRGQMQYIKKEMLEGELRDIYVRVSEDLKVVHTYVSQNGYNEPRSFVRIENKTSISTVVYSNFKPLNSASPSACSWSKGCGDLVCKIKDGLSTDNVRNAMLYKCRDTPAFCMEDEQPSPIPGERFASVLPVASNELNIPPENSARLLLNASRIFNRWYNFTRVEASCLVEPNGPGSGNVAQLSPCLNIGETCVAKDTASDADLEKEINTLCRGRYCPLTVLAKFELAPTEEKVSVTSDSNETDSNAADEPKSRELKQRQRRQEPAAAADDATNAAEVDGTAASEATPNSVSSNASDEGEGQGDGSESSSSGNGNTGKETASPTPETNISKNYVPVSVRERATRLFQFLYDEYKCLVPRGWKACDFNSLAEFREAGWTPKEDDPLEYDLKDYSKDGGGSKETESSAHALFVCNCCLTIIFLLLYHAI